MLVVTVAPLSSPDISLQQHTGFDLEDYYEFHDDTDAMIGEAGKNPCSCHSIGTIDACKPCFRRYRDFSCHQPSQM